MTTVLRKDIPDRDEASLQRNYLAAILRAAWPKLSPEAQKVFIMTPHFNPVRFKEITGIEVKVDAE